MSDNEKVTVTGGLSLASVLGVAFIILKLCKVIDWSWIWVLAPFWIGLGLSILMIIILLIVVIVVGTKY